MYFSSRLEIGVSDRTGAVVVKVSVAVEGIGVLVGMASIGVNVDGKTVDELVRVGKMVVAIAFCATSLGSSIFLNRSVAPSKLS